VRAGFGFATAFAARFFAGNRLKTGPAGVLVRGLFRSSHVSLEADLGAFVESGWVFRNGMVRDF
jgi:hypothetical protein